MIQAERLAARAAYMRAWRNTNHDKALEIERRAYAKHKDKKNARRRERWAADDEYREKNLCRTANSRNDPARRLAACRRAKEWRLNNPDLHKETRLRRYGISTAERAAMLAAQDGACAICGVPEVHCKRALDVDHDHDTGKVRGLLCSKCNTAIGLLNDDLEILARAFDYLKTGNIAP